MSVSVLPKHLISSSSSCGNVGKSGRALADFSKPLREAMFLSLSAAGTSDGIRQKLTRKERDIETGLDYFWARHYSSAQGRFITVDPLMASAKTGDPQTWNRYAYVVNNPLRYVDPDGMDGKNA
jgi:RHS repeat-associated protein